MALEVKNLKRVLELEKNGQTIYLDDPNPEMTIEEVIDFNSNNYPELLNSTYSTSELDDKLIYKFKSVAGTKG